MQKANGGTCGDGDLRPALHDAGHGPLRALQCGAWHRPRVFDPLTALEQWVEQGAVTAPTRHQARQEGKALWTRPLCPHPQVRPIPARVRARMPVTGPAPSQRGKGRPSGHRAILRWPLLGDAIICCCQPERAAELSCRTRGPPLHRATRHYGDRSSPLISASACSNQKGMSISRYIIVAVVRCSWICAVLPVRR